MTVMKVGQLASPEEKFCPFAAVTKWPYRHLYGEEVEIVSSGYFAHGRFRSRGWTVYYIHTLLDFHEGKPLLLIPFTEVEALFREIDSALGIYRGFPDITRHPGFVLRFQEGPRPRYLGRLTDNVSLLDLEAMIPDSLGEEPEQVEDRSFPAFRRKMEAAIQAGKNSKKNARDKKRKERVSTKNAWCAELKRAQCYLGVRPRGNVKVEEFHSNPNHTYEESLAAQEAYEKAAGIRLPQLIPTESAPYPFDKSVVFVCVDVEAYEKDQKKITEVGIATLDTQDLTHLPPGEGGGEWMKKIRARHFRIAEHAHLNNTDFISGCADKFEEKFGTSEWISIQEAPKVIASCFRYPFSVPGDYLPYPADFNQVGRHGSGSRYLPSADDIRPKRNVVLVGHDIKADIEYLRNIGYDVTNLSNLIEAIDTADLFRAMKREQQPRNLGAVLLDLELVGWHLHNAGNDAGYTMEALIGISIAALKVTHAPTPDTEHLDAAAAEAIARLVEEVEEWKIADEEGGDGGEPVKLPNYKQMMEDRAFDQSMRRANKAEEKENLKFARDRARGGRGGRGNFHGLHKEDFPPLSSFVDRKGDIKYHAANEEKMRQKGDQNGRYQGNNSSSKKGPNNSNKEDGGAPVQDKKMTERLARLEDDEYFMM